MRYTIHPFVAGLLLVLSLSVLASIFNLSPLAPPSRQSFAFNKHESVPSLPRDIALDPEQAGLANHLAKKYKQPLAVVERIVHSAYENAEVVGVSPLLILAIIEKESSFRHDVVNYYGAMGLMQVVPRYHKDKLQEFDSPKELLEPEVNIKVGAKILREYLNGKGGDLKLALVKYSGNARSYYDKVIKYQADLKQVTRKSNAQSA